MLEILFTESAYGAMQVARGKNRKDDVFVFPLGLSVGNIKDCSRDAGEQLSNFIQKVSSGEDARIWYSSVPDELCGFYWLMDKLCNLPESHGDIFAIEQPQFTEKAESICMFCGWGELAPEEFDGYIHLAKPLSDNMCRLLGNRWKELQQENAPLRAVVNGWLRSVPEDFYDSFIYDEINLQPITFMEAVVIGSVIGKHRLGISDLLIHQRIEKMVQNGYLEVVIKAKAGEPSYRRNLRKCGI